jgi:hypothetical protein
MTWNIVETSSWWGHVSQTWHLRDYYRMRWLLLLNCIQHDLQTNRNSRSHDCRARPLPSANPVHIRTWPSSNIAVLRILAATRNDRGVQEAVDSQSPSRDRNSDTPCKWQLTQPLLAPYQFWRESPEEIHGTSVQRQCALLKSNAEVSKSSCRGIEAEQDHGKDLGACPKLSREASLALKGWFMAHLADPMGPYPNRSQKERLAEEINCSRQQVENWFLNARRRWKHSQNALSRNVYAIYG